MARRSCRARGARLGHRQPAQRRLRAGRPEHERHAGPGRGDGAAVIPPLVLKFGGELLEEPSRLASVVAAVRAIAGPLSPLIPLVIVHGGGKEIDAALNTAGIDKRQVDGLRITDDATLDIVVAVLAGAVNTRF